MSLTITIPGAVDVTTGSTAPATLTIGVGVPGATGPQGPAGQGVPAGGTAGQFLTKIDGTNYNTDWTTVNLSAYAVKANNLSDLASASTARTNLGLGTMATATAANYSTTAAANLLYAPIDAGQPTAGTVGQVLTKNSGTSYDSSWQTLIPGDRYLTSSTTSLTINNANKTLTIGTGLSYSSQQDIVITYDAANHMHARVLTYNSGTGVMDVDVLSHSGSGTYAAWTVNVGGAPALASVVWGDITGTLGNQTDLANALNDKLELSGGVLDANATIQSSTATEVSVFSGSGLNAELSANPSENSVLNYAGLQVQNFSGTMAVTPSGLTFPNSSTQTVAFPGFAGYATESWVSAGFYPLTGNPSSFLVAADIAGKANSASPALTGNVTITTNSTSPALVITQDGTGDVVQFKDVTSDTTYTFIDANGKVNTIASATANAGFAIPHGAAPTTPVNGDVWTTTGGLFAYINGGTRQFATLSDGQSFSGNNTFTGPTLTFGNTTAASTVNIATGATLTATTKAVNIGTAGASGSTTNVIIGSSVAGAGCNVTVNGVLTTTGGTQTINNGTGATTTNIATGATLTATTKAVNIGTNGVAGSTTNIAIGSITGTSTTTLQGITNGVTQSAGDSSLKLATTAFVTTADNLKANLASPTFTGTPLSTTAAADTNTTQIATTAYVVGQASSTSPVMDGTATIGTSLKYARADHVHPTDTSRAPLASPAFTGTPSLPTGTTAVTQTAGNNTTAVATTAFVQAAIPAAATHTQAVQFASSTTYAKVIDAASQRIAPSAHRIWPSPSNYNGSATSGTGATSSLTLIGCNISAPNVGTAGSASYYHGNVIGDVGYMLWGGAQTSSIDFSKRVSMSFRFSQYPSDVNSSTRVVLGKIHGTAVGDLTSKGIGVKYTQVGAGYWFYLQVHNGTTLTNVQSSTQYAGGVADLEVVSDGAGNATLYLNGVSVATTTGAPTTTTATSATVFAEIDSTVSATAKCAANIGRLFVNSLNF